MPKYNLSPAERETIIRYDASSDLATVYTSDPAEIRKLDRIAAESLMVTMKKVDEYSRTYVLPKKLVKLSKPCKLSDDQREKRASVMGAVRAAKAAKQDSESA